MSPYIDKEHSDISQPASAADKELDFFFDHAYYDMRFFIKSITKSNNSVYTYFGDMQKNIFYVSDNMKETFGFESNIVEDLLEKWREFIHGNKWKVLYDRDRTSLIANKRETHDMRYQVEDKDGKVFWIRCYGSLKWNEDKTRPLFFSGRIARQDEHFTVDPVTNFPSEDTLQLRLDELSQNNQSRLIIGFGLNNITQINSLNGRSTVDRMLEDISMNLMDTLIDKMAFYRLSGIRALAIVEPDVEESKDELVARMRQVINAGYDDMGITVDNPCSFAIVNYPQHNLSPKDFQERMILLIKLAASERHLPYIENSEENIKKIHDYSNMQLSIASDVLNGMKNFRAVLQPVVSADTGRIVSGEMLMRWNYMGRDISPAVFIPILEKDRMIHIAGRWVLEQAVKACSKMTEHIPDICISVNISLQQLMDEEILGFIPMILEKYKLPGWHLVLEMTESCMDKEPAKLQKLIDVCNKLGVRLALDDFGTGYSSLRVLLRYNTDVIKLDRSLLLEMTESQDKSNFISSIVYACHQFGKKVCVEGVENETQLRLVRDVQCDLIQGFYYYRPTELNEIYRIVEEQGKHKKISCKI